MLSNKKILLMLNGDYYWLAISSFPFMVMSVGMVQTSKFKVASLDVTVCELRMCQ